jgi:hypothetical protein
MTYKSPVLCTFCDAIIYRRPTKSGTFFCNTDCKAKWQVLQRERLGFTKDWLIEQYFVLKKDCTQISNEIGRDSKSVWNWFKWYGIKIRPRGGYTAPNCYKEGHKQGVGRIHTEGTKTKIRKARIADGHVPYLKNGIHWLKHPGAVSPSWKGGITPQRQSFYASAEWVNAVKSVWERDNAVCQRCGKHHNTEKNRGSFHIHHIVSFVVIEKRADLNNLVLLCKECHRWVHSNKNTLKHWLSENSIKKIKT